MKKFLSLFSVGASLLVLILGITSPTVFAATSTNPGVGQALEIAPPLLTLTANPGQVLKTTIQLRDITKSSLVVTNEINDFVSNGVDGTPKILMGNESNNDPFSMKNWVTPLPAFTLTPGQIQSLPMTISVPKDASPGGHYSVIRFSGVPPNLQGSGVSLSASLGALVLLTVSGKLTHNVSINKFTVSKYPDGTKPAGLFQSSPLYFAVKLNNSGNIQEEPTGHIVVSDLFGKAVAGVNINLPPRDVLPDSTRNFIGSLDKSNLGTKRLFGLYHAKITVGYGDNYKQTTTDSITFWVIPFKLIGIIILLLIIAFFVIRYLLQRYKKQILKQTTRSSSSKQPTKRRRM
jgi:hypothetical protein